MEVNTGALQEPFKILPPPKWERNLSYTHLFFNTREGCRKQHPPSIPRLLLRQGAQKCDRL